MRPSDYSDRWLCRCDRNHIISYHIIESPAQISQQWLMFSKSTRLLHHPICAGLFMSMMIIFRRPNTDHQQRTISVGEVNNNQHHCQWATDNAGQNNQTGQHDANEDGGYSSHACSKLSFNTTSLVHSGRIWYICDLYVIYFNLDIFDIYVIYFNLDILGARKIKEQLRVKFNIWIMFVLHKNIQDTIHDCMNGEIKASEMLVAPRISECFGLL